MATRQRTVDFITDQLSGLQQISARKMFGEYGLWCGGTLVALICDDQLYLKKTAPGGALVGPTEEVAPYPGAKPALLIDPDRWEDRDWLQAVILATAAALPPPAPKRRRKA